MREYFTKLGSPFHIYNRGTEKRVIFSDYHGYCRFVCLMWIARIGKPNMNLSRKNVIKAAQDILSGKEPDPTLYTKQRPPLVAFITWTLLPNHLHFILVSLVPGGISKYMAKLANAYTKYFNARHQRNGRLFQSSYQSIEIDSPQYFDVLIRYINFNQAELIEPKWKERRLKNKERIKNFADNYQWSAHQEFLGKRQSLLIDRELVSKLFGKPFTERGLEGYSEFIEQWFSDDFAPYQKYTREPA